MTSFLHRLKALWNPAASTRSGRTLRRAGCKPRLEILEPRLALAVLELSGTFNMESFSGTIGLDLVAIMGHDNGWTLALDDVSYSHAEESGTHGADYDYTTITRVHTASFQFQFTGPDAAVLNEAVGQHFIGGGLTGGAFFEAKNATCIYTRIGDDNHGEYALHLVPADPSAGVSLGIQCLYTALFPQDPEGWPTLPATMLDPYASTNLTDLRPGNEGTLSSPSDEVRIGNSDPLPPPTLNVASDIAQYEGKKGWTAFVFTVTLSSASNVSVSVECSTANGSATAGNDFDPVNGTLVFQPGEKSRTITVWVKGDSKREANESFYLCLSGATNAVIEDDLALGLILNDD